MWLRKGEERKEEGGQTVYIERDASAPVNSPWIVPLNLPL